VGAVSPNAVLAVLALLTPTSHTTVPLAVLEQVLDSPAAFTVELAMFRIA
jgi:hypothetical protein